MVDGRDKSDVIWVFYDRPRAFVHSPWLERLTIHIGGDARRYASFCADGFLLNIK